MKGRWFSGSSAYSANVASVFFPAAGGSGKNKDSKGEYWSSTTGTDPDYHFGYVINLDFSSTSVSSDRTLTTSTSTTHSVRCVKK